MNFLRAVSFMLLLSFCASGFAQHLDKFQTGKTGLVFPKDLTDVYDTIDKYWKAWSLQHLSNEAFNGTYSSSCSAGWNRFWSTTGDDGIPLALKVIDASGKLGAGYLKGNVFAFGSYDECFAIKSVRYCIIPLTIVIRDNNTRAELPLNLGVCIPAECTESDISQVINSIPLSFLMVTQGEVVLAIDESGQMICSTQRNSPYNIGAIIMIAVCSLFAFLVLLGTGVHYLISTDWQVSSTMGNIFRRSFNLNMGILSLMKNATENNSGRSKKSSGPGSLDFITAFSLFKNIPNILSTKRPQAAITSLDGIRVISMFWVILGHSFIWALVIPTENSFFLFNEVPKRFLFQPALNGYFSVDSFFFLSGFLVTLVTLRKMDRNRGHFPALMYYMHRYLRLTPTYAFILFFSWLLTLYIGDGPIFNSVTGEGSPWYQNCEKYWWTNLLYINNLYPWNGEDECLGWTWYLANDMQFYIVAPLMVVLLYHSLPVGLAVVGGFLAASLTITGALAGVYKWPAHGFISDEGYNQSNYLYIKPWARIAPYIVGIMLGYMFFKKMRLPFSKSINWIIAFALWALAALFCMSPVFGFYSTFHGHEKFTEWENILYLTFARLAWSLGLAIVVFTCHNGYGGVVNSFLSLKIWVPLSRLTFTAYLIHPVILTVIFTTLRSPFYYTDITMAVYIISAIVLSFTAAGVLTACVELPLSNTEAALLRKLGFGSHESAQRVIQADKIAMNSIESCKIVETTLQKTGFQLKRRHSAEL